MINFKNVAKDSPSNSFSARSYLKAINFLWVKNRSIKAWTLVYCVCTARSQHAGLANPTFLTLCKKAKLMKCGSPKLNVLAATQSKFLCPSLRNRVLNEFSFSTVRVSDAASGWAGWALAQPEFGSSINPITTRGQIMPTTLLLAHPDLKTQWHLCTLINYPVFFNKNSLKIYLLW